MLGLACRGGDPPADTSAVAADMAPTSAARSAPTLTAEGFGSVRIGMSLDSARQAVGEPGVIHDTLAPECDYVRLTGLPEGVTLMIIDGRIVRIDMQAPGLATAEGARIGDSEPRIDSLYAPAVRREPHKYVDGSYLIVPSAKDTTRQLVFETDGRVVTAFRAGMLPMVRWVEGCS
jgi:hypothetical protein